MRKVEKIVFTAFDGREFNIATECLDYEKANAELRLIGLSAEELADGMSRKNLEIADAIEIAGNKVSQARRAAGDMKRVRKTTATPSSSAVAAAAEESNAPSPSEPEGGAAAEQEVGAT